MSQPPQPPDDPGATPPTPPANPPANSPANPPAAPPPPPPTYGTPPPSPYGAPPAPPPYGAAPPPPYGAPSPYGGPPGAPGNQKALWAMITGIVGLLCCVVASVVAIVLGAQARREIRASGGRQGGDGQALTGLVLGIVGCVLWGAFIVFYAIAAVIGSTNGY